MVFPLQGLGFNAMNPDHVAENHQLLQPMRKCTLDKPYQIEFVHEGQQVTLILNAYDRSYLFQQRDSLVAAAKQKVLERFQAEEEEA